jgi:hypothetical protein
MSDPYERLSGFPTWRDFNAKVDKLCPLERKRIFGTKCEDGSSVYYREQIRQAILDLKNFIPEYTRNHESIYYPADFADDGQASVGALPPMAQVRSAWYYGVESSDPAKHRRFEVINFPWEKRFEMTSREIHDFLDSDYITLTAASISALAMAETLDMFRANGRRRVGMMAISPTHERFYLYPKLAGPWIFSLFWDGQKLDYRDNEHVPFDEDTAGAVAFYVKSQFNMYVDREPALAEANGKMYTVKRTNIMLRLQAKGFIK